MSGHRLLRDRSAWYTSGPDGKGDGRTLPLSHNLTSQGLKVVGVDIRAGPLSLAGSLRLAPDLLLNAANISSTEGAKMVEQLRPQGWDRGPGCDGECAHYCVELTR